MKHFLSDEEIREIKRRGDLLKRFYPQLSDQAKEVLLFPTLLLVLMGVKPGYRRFMGTGVEEPDPMVLAEELERIPEIWQTMGLVFYKYRVYDLVKVVFEVIRHRDFLEKMGVLTSEDHPLLEDLERTWREQNQEDFDGNLNMLIELLKKKAEANVEQHHVIDGIFMGFPKGDIQAAVESAKDEPVSPISTVKLGTDYADLGLAAQLDEEGRVSEELYRYLARMDLTLSYAYSLFRDSKDFRPLAKKLGLPERILREPPPAIFTNRAEVREGPEPSLRGSIANEAEAISGPKIASPIRPTLAPMRGALFGKNLTFFSESVGARRPSGRPPLDRLASASRPPRNDGQTPSLADAAEKATLRFENARLIVDFEDLAQNFSDEQILEIIYFIHRGGRIDFAQFNPVDEKGFGRFFLELKSKSEFKDRIVTHRFSFEFLAQDHFQGFAGDVFYLASPNSELDRETLRSELGKAGIGSDQIIPLAYHDQTAGTLGAALAAAVSLLKELPDYFGVDRKGRFIIVDPSETAFWQAIYHAAYAFARSA